MKRLFIGILFLTTCFQGFAQQHPDEGGNINQLNNYQDSLKELGNKFINDENDLERKNANYAFIRLLVTALKVPHSFGFKFDSLKAISIINSPDNHFRIFTWHVVNEDGSCRFYGTIQMNSDRLLMYPMEDTSPFIKNAEDTVTDTRKWYGAQYYNIIPVNDLHPYYVLLGWKGNTVKSNKKVIEVLSFDNKGHPQFGKAIFDGNGKTRKRIVFEYARQASMLLRYEPSQHLIVFDHLSPPDKNQKNDMASYGPDLSYDGYRMKNGRWVFSSNLDMRNVPTNGDDQLVDPKIQAMQDKNAIGNH